MVGRLGNLIADLSSGVNGKAYRYVSLVLDCVSYGRNETVFEKS